MGYALNERERAIMAEQVADENAMKAEENAEGAAIQAAYAQNAIEEASQQVEQLRAELEACKKKK